MPFVRIIIALLVLITAVQAQAQHVEAVCINPNGPNGQPLCQAQKCGRTPQEAEHLCGDACPGSYIVGLGASNCQIPNARSSPIPNTNPVVKDDHRSIPFSQASEADLNRLRQSVQSLNAKTYNANPDPAQVMFGLRVAKGDYHVLYLFNVGHQAGNGHATPYGTGRVDIPEGTRIKAVYMWVPDINQTYSGCGNWNCLSADQANETHLMHKDGTKENYFSISGLNATKKSHYVQIDFFFEKVPATSRMRR